MKCNKYFSLAALPAAILYLEFATKYLCFGVITPRSALFTALFSLAAGALLTLLCALFGQKHFFPALTVVTALLCLNYIVQNVYFSIFTVFLSPGSVGEAGGVMADFRAQALVGVFRAWPRILLLLLPLAELALLRRYMEPLAGRKLCLRAFTAFLLLHLSAVVCLYAAPGGAALSPQYLYTNGFTPELGVRSFGLLTAERIGLVQYFHPTSVPLPTQAAETSEIETPAPVETAVPESPAVSEAPAVPNVLPIDFDALAAEETDETLRRLHAHFAEMQPTTQNEYTGLFKGKNLIWIVAEGFSDLALDETHTPTLWKLAHSGFVFRNFYTPLWGVSTSDGEYVTLTGLLPKSGVWSFTQSADNDMRMTFGRMLSAQGYDCRAYHDHTYTYYNRDKSHPNLGYAYTGVGNGLELERVWPASDLEMMQKTVPDYIGSDRFHTYYMTVSGHQYYTFMGNTQSWKHQEDVADLPYSEGSRAYIACNMEFDLAVQNLMEQLSAAGKLTDTVIVISGDHYPYGLSHGEIEELRGHSVDENFELYRSALILWSGDMTEPIEIEKPCAAVDIMPTLANLFGLDFDSRLLAGRDILSDAPGLVIFANRSFLSEYGRYDSTLDEFIPADGVEVPEDYARDMLYGRVSDAFTYSAAILDNDYYSIVLPDDFAR